MEEYKAHETDDSYTDGLMTCPRCRHRSIISNISTCMYGDCDKKCKAAAALKKITKKAEAINVSNKHLANNVTSHLANNVTSE